MSYFFSITCNKKQKNFQLEVNLKKVVDKYYFFLLHKLLKIIYFGCNSSLINKI